MPVEPQDQPDALEAARRALYRPGAGAEEVAAFQRMRTGAPAGGAHPGMDAGARPRTVPRHPLPLLGGLGLVVLLATGALTAVLARQAPPATQPSATARPLATAAAAAVPSATATAPTGSALPPDWKGARVVAAAGPARGSQYLPTGVPAEAFLLLVDCPTGDGTWRAAWDGLVTLSAPCGRPSAVPLTPTGGTLRVSVDGLEPFSVSLLAR
ncbi:hypothetical protein [Amnibacterium setariae]|uniref:hypothetical protein n=1 Tax=Amnibacterium setariae TaxID=2306585 RepID=UPI0011C3F6AA|nr:hypothetical protein [Amnibacterium setariae]